MDLNKTTHAVAGTKRDASALDSDPESQGAGPKTKNSEHLNEPPRKRSRVACTWCRDRKVRCDVASHGTPCTNCELDRQDCALQPLMIRKPSTDQVSRPDTAKPANIAPKAPLRQSQSQVQASGSSRQPPATARYPPPQQPVSAAPKVVDLVRPPIQQQTNARSTEIFSFYPFLKLPGLRFIPSEDVRYLSAKGCLYVPRREALDEFVSKYFLYVHPCLPLLNEAEFWRIYRSKQGLSARHQSFSLFTFQAMLFASCAFVSPDTIKAAGFPDTRSARNSLYLRAKLLYDLKCEKDALACAQGSILLTYESSSVDLHAGSLWLSIAIENAIIYGAQQQGTGHDNDGRNPDTNTRKRIWWSILIRDRILPLGLRRHLQVTPRTFNLALDPLTEDDLEDEINHSEVYDPYTKRLLVKVLQVQCELCLVLTNIIMLVYAPKAFGHSAFMKEAELTNVIQQIEDGKGGLQEWSNNAKAAIGPVINLEGIHESVTLYFGLTFLYYHAARLALCHFEALTLSVHRVYLGTSLDQPFERIQTELEDAIGCVDDTIRRFLANGVAHHLPISAVAYTALPLLLNALDIRLSTTKSQSATRKRRFSHYANVMQLYQDRYDGTDSVAKFIQKALEVANTIMNSATPQGYRAGKKPSMSRSWSDMFAHNPQLYLRIALALDHAFTSGHFPEDTEIPGLIDNLLAESNRKQAQASGSSSSLPVQLPTTQPNPMASFTELLESTRNEPEEYPDLPPLTTQASPTSISSILNHPDSPYADMGYAPGSSYALPFPPFSPGGDMPSMILQQSPSDECHTFFNFESPAPEPSHLPTTAGIPEGSCGASDMVAVRAEKDRHPVP